MKHLIALFLIFCGLNFAQQNPFSGKLSPTLEGIATFSFTDYENSVTRFGLKLSGDYYLPMKGAGTFGTRLSVSKFQIAGEDQNKRPDKFKTNITSVGFGFSYLHSSYNVFFKELYAGISYIWFDPLLDSGQPASNNKNGVYEKTSATYDLGAGLKYLITPSITVNTNFNIHFLTHDNIDDFNAGKHWDVFSTLDLGITFLFGNSDDPDQDGIVGSRDKCPDQPEDRDGYMDDDGCPDPDNDKDGIPDVMDKCPDLAEDIDNFEDADGCPDPDNDKDGIPDKIDNCIDRMEDFDGYLDSDGCPDPDNDGDNIVDTKDQCPNAAEDYDNFQDEDGCPDLDNDGDGIPDVKDVCPNVAEDKDGFEDEDGCPDKDNDNDGIPDSVDKCPNAKETYNDYQDEDGCPDILPPLDKRTEQKTETKKTETSNNTFVPDEFNLDGVLTFYDEDYDIKPEAYPQLDRIVTMLKKDSTSRWRIEGHTDDVNPEKDNIKLSQQRATEVLLYFVKKGLRYPRFEAVGYGSKYPVADNKKPYGRAKNRRLVIKRIK